MATNEREEDGGPAFPMASGPEPRVNASTHYNEGMSLRDYFAGQAMPWIAKRRGFSPNDIAELAYAYADAMLAVRRQK